MDFVSDFFFAASSCFFSGSTYSPSLFLLYSRIFFAFSFEKYVFLSTVGCVETKKFDCDNRRVENF